MHPTLDDDAEIERRDELRLARARQKRAERFKEAQSWLALVPTWSTPLASACDFPSGKDDLPTFVKNAKRAGLCSYSEIRAPEGSTVLHFWMPEYTRVETLRDLGKTKNGKQSLQRDAATIGRRIIEAHSTSVPISETVYAWADLAQHVQDGLNNCSRYLIKRVRQLVDAKDTGRAQTLLAASKFLAQALGGSLETALRVGENYVELEYRREQDEIHLNRFRPIRGQIEAFQKLLTLPADSDVWALHYLGRGGVGKTMLLRYITGRLLTPQGSLPTPFSRIDFDYLSPDYPVRRPGQLLLELAAGFRPYITSQEQEQVFEEFQNRTIELHEALSGEPPPDNPLANLDPVRFDPILAAFSDFLLKLPQPVVLILDTCEELAKVQSIVGSMPTVEAAFEILERIHRKVPTVRVVFAGRRLLTRAGHDWHLSFNEARAEREFLPQRKDYLLLHEIRGFEEVEARAYLSVDEGLDRLGESLLTAILKNSLDNGRAAYVEHNRALSRDAATYYNPFYLSLYANWVREDPDLTAAEIGTGKTDPYVELRIVKRVDQSVSKVLPAVVQLRRFDKDMLAPALEDGESVDEVYRRLSGYEWINNQWDESLQTNFLEVDRNLHGRLCEYYEQQGISHKLDAAKQKLGPGLARLLRERTLDRLTTDHVDATLRLLPAAEAAEVWHLFERRIAADGDWIRALRTTERILSEEGAVKDESHPLRSAVVATHASALLHTLAEVQLDKVWHEVERTSHNHPDRSIGEWLRLRGMVGRYAAAARNATTDSSNHLLTITLIVDTLPSIFIREMERFQQEAQDEESAGDMRHRLNQLAASLCATLEELAERAECLGTSLFVQIDVSDIAAAFERFELAGDLVAFAHCLAARYVLLSDNGSATDRYEQAAKLIQQAESLATREGATQIRQHWLDWRAPASVRERVRLEWLRMTPLPLEVFDAQTLANWRQEAVGHLDNIDSERLASAVIKLELAARPLAAADLKAIEAAESYQRRRQPTIMAHHATPPLLCSLARAWLALGEAAHALDALTRRIAEAVETREDKSTVRAAEMTKLHIIRRMRLREHGADLINRLSRTGDPREVLSIRQLMAINRPYNPDALPPPAADAPPALLHAWWQSQAALTREMAVNAVEAFNKLALKRAKYEANSEHRATGDSAHLLLDWHEAMLIARMYKLGSLLPPVETAFDTTNLWEDTPLTQTEEGVRLTLRSIALGEFVGHRRFPDELHRRVGARRLAELALEEGEMLALRLPVHAYELLDIAYWSFNEVEDYVGATIAAVRRAIAQMHIEGSRAFSESLHRTLPNFTEQEVEIRRIYKRMASKNRKAPGWTEIDAARKNGTPDKLSELNHPSWSGWLHRMTYYLTTISAFGEDGEMIPFVQMREWLRKTYGQQLPLELTLLESEMGAVPLSGRLSRFLRVFGRNWISILGLTVMVLLMFSGGFYLAESGVKFFSPSMGLYLISCSVVSLTYFLWLAKKGLSYFQIVSYTIVSTLIISTLISLYIFLIFAGWILEQIVTAAIIGGVLLLLLAAVAKPIWRTILKLQAAISVGSSISSLQINTFLEETDPMLNIVSPKQISMHFSRKYLAHDWPVYFKEMAEHVEGSGETSGLHPYRDAALEVPVEVSSKLLKLIDQLMGPFKFYVPLQVNQSLAFYPWEAVLLLALERREIAQLTRRVHFWRRGEPIEKIVYRYNNRVDIISSQTWELMAETGWSPLTKFADATDQPHLIDGSETRRVLHLIGQVVNRSEGLRLKLSGRALHAPLEALGVGGSGRSASRGEREVLVGTEELPLRTSGLVVVQAEPAEVKERSQTEREKAAFLRAFAADVFAAGAHRVVMLPALPETLAARLLNQLAKGVASERRFSAFLETIAQMRRTVLHASEAGSEETRLELALDICVYARDNTLYS